MFYIYAIGGFYFTVKISDTLENFYFWFLIIINEIPNIFS